MTQLVSQSVSEAVRVFDVLKFVTPRDPETERGSWRNIASSGRRKHFFANTVGKITAGSRRTVI